MPTSKCSNAIAHCSLACKVCDTHSCALNVSPQQFKKQIDLQSELRSIERMLVLSGCAPRPDFVPPRHDAEHTRPEQAQVKASVHVELGVNTIGVVDDELAKINRFLNAV